MYEKIYVRLSKAQKQFTSNEKDFRSYMLPCYGGM